MAMAVAVADHGGGVDDEADVDAGVVEVDPRRLVVCRDHRDWFAPAVLLPQVRQVTLWLGLWGFAPHTRFFPARCSGVYG